MSRFDFATQIVDKPCRQVYVLRLAAEKIQRTIRGIWTRKRKRFCVTGAFQEGVEVLHGIAIGVEGGRAQVALGAKIFEGLADGIDHLRHWIL